LAEASDYVVDIALALLALSSTKPTSVKQLKMNPKPTGKLHLRSVIVTTTDIQELLTVRIRSIRLGVFNQTQPRFDRATLPSSADL